MDMDAVATSGTYAGCKLSYISTEFTFSEFTNNSKNYARGCLTGTCKILLMGDDEPNLVLYSLSGKTFYRQISWIREIGSYSGRVSLKFERHLGSAAKDIMNLNIAQ